MQHSLPVWRSKARVSYETKHKNAAAAAATTAAATTATTTTGRNVFFAIQPTGESKDSFLIEYSEILLALFQQQQWSGNQNQFASGGGPRFQGQMGQNRPQMMGKKPEILQFNCKYIVIVVGMNQGYSARGGGGYMNTNSYRQQGAQRGGGNANSNTGNRQQQQSQAALQNPQLMAQLQRGQQQQHYQQQNRF